LWSAAACRRFLSLWYIPPVAVLLYLATCAVCVWLVHRYVLPLSRAAALVLFALPLAIVGYALVTGGVYGPVDHIYQYEPLDALAPQFGIGPARNASAIDIWSEFFPWRLAVRESLERAEWPLWNAYNLAGHPLAAEAQSAPYSPFTLIACLLPAMVSQTYSLAIAMFIAGLCAFVFARDLGCREGAALVAAIGWGLASCVGSRMTAMGFATAYAPLLLAATRRVIRQPGVAPGMLLMVTLALQLLAGHPESLFLNVLVGGIYAIFELVRHRANVGRAIVTAIAAGVVSLLVCAIFLLPLLEAIPQSHEYLIKRDALEDVKHGLSTEHVLAALATNFFPHLHVRHWLSPRLGYIAPETTPAGSLIVALAIYAIWRRRSAETWFFAALAVFCLLTGARWSPLADTLHQLPLLNITLHDRLAFHGAICLIVLAALGVEHLLRTDDRKALAITMIAVLALLAIGTWWLEHNITLAETPADYGRYRVLAELVFLAAAPLLLRRKVFLPALLALIVGQRAIEEIDTFPTFPAKAAYPPVAMLEPLQKIREPFRLVGRATAFPPATNTFYGVEDPRGYEALTLDQFHATWRLWCRLHGIWFNRVDDLNAPFLSLMNVRFAIQSDALPVPEHWRVIGRQKGALLLENARAIDRVFVPRRVILSGASTEELVDRMAGVQDFREIAWITGRGEPGQRENGPGRIALRSYSRKGEYVFDAEMEGDGYVVISDASWRGWQAWIDGKRVPMNRANAAFLSVLVPRGRHTVRVVYWPSSFVRGRAISVWSAAAVAAALVFRKRRRAAAALMTRACHPERSRGIPCGCTRSAPHEGDSSTVSRGSE
jgi:Bacterial membrane protein YfhO